MWKQMKKYNLKISIQIQLKLQIFTFVHGFKQTSMFFFNNGSSAAHGERESEGGRWAGSKSHSKIPEITSFKVQQESTSKIINMDPTQELQI